VILRSAGIAMLALIVANLAIIGVAVTQYPAFFLQPGARIDVREPIFVLVAYAFAAVLVGRTGSPGWDAAVRTATLFGILGGTAEAFNIAIENGIPAAIHIPALLIAFMFTIFASWGVAGFRTTRSLNSSRAGVLAAVLSASICMLIAVVAGFAIQFFAARPEPSYISTWDEFKRSGWTDARAFGLANTLESAFTHLVIAPVVALVAGGVASFLAQSRSFKETSATPVGRSGL
jgi:hypothetical protein